MGEAFEGAVGSLCDERLTVCGCARDAAVEGAQGGCAISVRGLQRRGSTTKNTLSARAFGAGRLCSGGGAAVEGGVSGWAMSVRVFVRAAVVQQSRVIREKLLLAASRCRLHCLALPPPFLTARVFLCKGSPTCPAADRTL